MYFNPILKTQNIQIFVKQTDILPINCKNNGLECLKNEYLLFFSNVIRYTYHKTERNT